jgi:hypothetical protein
MSAWVNSNSWGAGWRCVFRSEWDGGSEDFSLYINNGYAVFYNNSSVLTGATSLSNSAWHHVALTFDGVNTSALYVDGYQDGTASATPVTGSTPSTTNMGGDRYSQTLNGKGDEFHFANSARSSDWIKAEYNNQNAPGNIGSAGFWTFGAKTALAIARRRIVVVQ